MNKYDENYEDFENDFGDIKKMISPIKTKFNGEEIILDLAHLNDKIDESHEREWALNRIIPLVGLLLI